VQFTRKKERTMNVSELMTKAVQSCSTNDNLQRAAQIMWENDCGAAPVVDGDGRVVGMITDRDICMAAYTQGQPLWQIPVSAAMAKQVHGVTENDPLEVVETMMRRVRVRRVPVLDGAGRLRGILSMNDLVRRAHHSVGRKANGLSSDSVVQTLAAICAPHAAASAKEPATAAGSRPQV
jgi:CBS domain-containing protein